MNDFSGEQDRARAAHDARGVFGPLDAPWRTQWHELIVIWTDDPAHIASFGEQWRLSLYEALQWKWAVNPPNGDIAHECFVMAKDQFEQAYADELAEAAACHAIEGTHGHQNWPGNTLRDLTRIVEDVPSDPRGLWPVECTLLRLTVDTITSSPQYTPDAMHWPIPGQDPRAQA